MKVNLKKLGAIVAGATILASSVAFAGLYFGNTQLVNDNGAPQVKVVVGANAAASDGVAAANIAAKIASEAFKTSKLTASVSGTATYGTTGNATTGVTLTNKACKLSISVPTSATPGEYSFYPLLGEYVDRTLLDRYNETGNAATGLLDSNYSQGTDDLGEYASPWTSGTSGTSFATVPGSATEAQYMYKIGTVFDPFATVEIKDSYEGLTYKEYQNLWIAGPQTYAYYAAADDTLVSSLQGVAYSLKFDGPGSKNFGVPVCAKVTSGTDYTVCADSYKTTAHKVKVRYLGSDWVISEMSAPTNASNWNTETALYHGGYVTLAVESTSGVIKKGDKLEVQGYSFILDDVEVAGTSVSAAITVKDAAGNEKTKKKIGTTATEDVSVDGTTYRVHVYQAVGGLTWAATWADIAVFAKEMKLEDSYELPPTDTNDGWKAWLAWKNRGATTSSNQPDHLRAIVIYGTDISKLSDAGTDTLKAGNYIPLPEDTPAFKLSFEGIDLTSSDRDTLKFTHSSDATATLTGMNTNTTATCTLAAPYVKVTSGIENAFKLAAAEGDSHYNEFYVALAGASCTGETYNGQTAGPDLGPGAICMKRSKTVDGYYCENLTNASTFLSKGENTEGWELGNDVVYSAVGDASEAFESGGVIRIAWIQNATMIGRATNPTFADFLFIVNEKAGTGVSEGASDSFVFYIDNQTSPSFDPSTRPTVYSSMVGGNDSNWTITSSAGELYYLSVVDDDDDYFTSPQYTSGSKEKGFVSQRGSVFKDISSASVTFNMAKKLGKAKYTLKSTGETVVDTTANVQTVEEGKSYTTSNNVVIKVLEVQATGSCTAGTGGAPTCDMTGVKALIMPENKETVDATMPYVYGSYAPLVVLDKDAIGTEALITVGGPVVNTVTAEVLSGADFTAAAVDNKVVKEVVAGKKIVVAGVNAEDTVAAAADFIAALTSKAQ